MNTASTPPTPSQTDPSTIVPTLTIRELRRGDDPTAFRTLNEEWISRYFVLEAKDREQLEHPETILERGGHIYLAHRENETVGCVALVPLSATSAAERVYELSKMAVAPHLRRLGIGRLLLGHAIAQARILGAHSLFLGSNTTLAGAVRLYESAGFRHLPPDRLPNLAYTRANVFMELPLR